MSFAPSDLAQLAGLSNKQVQREVRQSYPGLGDLPPPQLGKRRAVRSTKRLLVNFEARLTWIGVDEGKNQSLDSFDFATRSKFSVLK